MRTAFMLVAAATLHSVHRSSNPFIEGPDGCPIANVDRYERDPFVCFVEGGEGTGGTPKTFTQEEVNSIVKRETEKLERKLTDTHSKSIEDLTSKVNALTQAAEDAGKSEKEKAEAKAARERVTLETTLENERKARAESDAKAAEAGTALRDTRTDYELNAILGGHKVLPEAMRFALSGFRQDAKLEYAEDGKTIVGVDFGTERHTSLKAGVDAWMKTNGSIFTPAAAGGVGIKASSGITGAKNMGEMSASELAAAVNATETNASSGR